jgi:hypothetical protein
MIIFLPKSAIYYKYDKNYSVLCGSERVYSYKNFYFQEFLTTYYY